MKAEKASSPAPPNNDMAGNEPKGLIPKPKPKAGEGKPKNALWYRSVRKSATHATFDSFNAIEKKSESKQWKYFSLRVKVLN